MALVFGVLLAGASPTPGAIGFDGPSGPMGDAFRGEAFPVLVRIEPGSDPDDRSFLLLLAPGEVRRGEEVAVFRTDGSREELGIRIRGRYPDGSVARLEGTGQHLRTGEILLLVRPARVADPANLISRKGAARADPESGESGTAVLGGAVARLVREGLWHGELEARGSGKPSWWEGADARFPVGSEPEDLEARIEFVQVAYAEKGRPRRAIKLFHEIAADAGPVDGTRPDTRGSRGRLRAWLRACHEIAHLYGGSLQDHHRALAWSLRCAEAPVTDPGEERQNRIAAGLTTVRALEGIGHRGPALALYRILARDLLLDPDPYGTLLLPRIFLRIGDAELSRGNDDRAEVAYGAAVAAAGRLPEGAPSQYLAPGSAARASLRRLTSENLDLGRVPVGAYRGMAFGYNAPVEVRLTCGEDRCAELHVTELGDKRPLDAYRVLPERILEAQSLEVDAVTGATVTSRAIVSAVTDAVFEAVGEGSERKGDRDDH